MAKRPPWVGSNLLFQMLFLRINGRYLPNSITILFYKNQISPIRHFGLPIRLYHRQLIFLKGRGNVMDLKKEKELLAENPFYIYLMVKAAKQALDEGRAIIQDGVLILQNQE